MSNPADDQWRRIRRLLLQAPRSKAGEGSDWRRFPEHVRGHLHVLQAGMQEGHLPHCVNNLNAEVNANTRVTLDSICHSGNGPSTFSRQCCRPVRSAPFHRLSGDVDVYRELRGCLTGGLRRLTECALCHLRSSKPFWSGATRICGQRAIVLYSLKRSLWWTPAVFLGSRALRTTAFRTGVRLARRLQPPGGENAPAILGPPGNDMREAAASDRLSRRHHLRERSTFTPWPLQQLRLPDLRQELK
ncbi:hypothetical protein AAFF_G00422520 [Aldrovandia affinis]|uniref:Uncharacterized protein n=1 Tax=Aldrovandia affinis TaxID=143900 RepID=A0AAD7WZT5_9TELE|nr:hypothetical protein AAFF_G00422520 [Aldrovandia affinis]